MIGRPSKLRSALLSQLRQGRSLAEAERRVGIHRRTVHTAWRCDPGLRTAVETARREGREAERARRAARQARFLACLASCPSVAEASRRAGLPARQAYRARKRDGAFAAAWDAAAARFAAGRRAAFLTCLSEGATLGAACRTSGLDESVALRARRREPAFAAAWAAAIGAAEEARERRWERHFAARRRAAAESAQDLVNGYPSRVLLGLLTRQRPARFKARPSRPEMAREGARLLSAQLRQNDDDADKDQRGGPMSRITKAQKDAFFERLGETGNIRDACSHAGFGPYSVFRLRRAEESFARRLEEALDRGMRLLELELLRRALDGWREPVFHQGVQCGEIVRHDNLLGLRLLKARRPEVYGDRQQVEHSGEMTVRALLDSVDGVSRAGPDAD